VEIIRTQNAIPCGVAIALDRQERGQGALSAVQEVQQQFSIPVVSIAGLADLIAYLEVTPTFSAFRPAIERYRAEYGID
jgi:orotate phosphoribosyltransferase